MIIGVMLILNLTGTVVGSNQSHVLINSNKDSLENTIVDGFNVGGIIAALSISIITLRKGMKEGKQIQEFQAKSVEAQNELVETQDRLSKFQRLIEVCDMNNTFKQREARKNIYNACSGTVDLDAANKPAVFEVAEKRGRFERSVSNIDWSTQDIPELAGKPDKDLENMLRDRPGIVTYIEDSHTNSDGEGTY